MAAMRTDLLSGPGSAPYEAATSPHTSSVVQRPVMVARPTSAEEVAESMRWAADRDLRVAVQASGHGAGAPIGEDQLLIDTSALNTVQIDVAARTATVGAGATWTAVNALAQRHGLRGLAGTSPTVAAAGYTFGGGVGWLTRPHGMASSALLAVEYIDGEGRFRRAAEDAPDPVDREACGRFAGAAVEVSPPP